MYRISLLIGAVSMLIALCSANPLEKKDSLAGLGLNGIGGNSPTCDAWISDKMAETGLAVDDIAKSKHGKQRLSKTNSNNNNNNDLFAFVICSDCRS